MCTARAIQERVTETIIEPNTSTTRSRQNSKLVQQLHHSTQAITFVTRPCKAQSDAIKASTERVNIKLYSPKLANACYMT